VWAITDYLSSQGYSTDLVEALELGIKASRLNNQRYSECALLNKLGDAYRNLGRIEESDGKPGAMTYYQQALDIAREISDQVDEGDALERLGLAHQALGQLKRSVKYYEQALSIAREIRDHKSEIVRLSRIARAYLDAEQIGDDEDREGALTYYQRALKVAQNIGDDLDESKLLSNLGLIHLTLRKLNKAIGYFEAALKITRENEYDEKGEYEKVEAFAAWNLGVTYTDQAAEFMRVRLDYAREKEHADAEHYAERVEEIRSWLKEEREAELYWWSIE
jgi:tetratricopeptide (TPR) repeat protein